MPKLSWSRYEHAATAMDEHVGKDSANPVMCARIYRADAVTRRKGAPWFWTVATDLQIASGFAASEKLATEAAQAAYDRYLVSHSQS